MSLVNSELDLIPFEKSPLIIGHRGASALAPENTLAAFARAFDDGADGIELDVRLARDGVPVVIHDATLSRTGTTKKAVADMTSAELGRADVGSWFNQAHPQRARDDYAQQSVPTLEQVFRVLNTSSRKNSVVYLELKIDKGGTYADLVNSVVGLISLHKFHSRTVVVSFNLRALALSRQLDTSIRTGALFQAGRNPARIVRKSPMITAAVDCGASEILLHRLIATPKIITDVLKKGLVPVVWTVEDLKWVSRAENSGIHALITNDPRAFWLRGH